jgi:two-component system, OmpR family, response regulator
MKNDKPQILLVDDDVTLCALLQEYLQEDNFDVMVLHSGDAAISRLLQQEEFDTVVLDIMMPKVSGLDVLRTVRAKSKVPILMLTGRGDDIDRIIGLEMGADDYLTKPCNPRELAARIRAILRRTQQEPISSNQHFELHGIVLDSGSRSVSVNGQIALFTSAEFNALRYLMGNVGQTISKQDMTVEVLNRQLDAYDRSMDVHISRIRQKLAAMGVLDVIKSVRGMGYQFLTERLGD